MKILRRYKSIRENLFRTFLKDARFIVTTKSVVICYTITGLNKIKNQYVYTVFDYFFFLTRYFRRVNFFRETKSLAEKKIFFFTRIWSNVSAWCICFERFSDFMYITSVLCIRSCEHGL